MIARLRCWLGWPRWVLIDPTGGDPDLGGPVWVDVCAWCHAEEWSHR